VVLLSLHSKDFTKLTAEDVMKVKEMEYTYPHITSSYKSGFARIHFVVVARLLTGKQRSKKNISQWVDILRPRSGKETSQALRTVCPKYKQWFLSTNQVIVSRVKFVIA